MFYEETETNNLRVAYCDPQRMTCQDVAESFGLLVLENLRDGADVATVEKWATYAGHYGRLALELQDEQERDDNYWKNVATQARAFEKFMGIVWGDKQ